jgi:hypothetical protein
MRLAMAAMTSDRVAKEASSRWSLVPRLLVVVLLIGMAGCASHRAPVATPLAAAPEAPARTGGYVGGTVVMECAPFARAVSGVDLKGPAADWWWAAAGRYTRTSTPVVGSVLTFRRTSRLPDGHAAVVSRLVSTREIRVTQANWVHSRVTDDMPVIDISERNDWTLVRVWWPPSGQLGSRHYPTWGFITPERPAVRDALEAAMMRIVLAASSP